MDPIQSSCSTFPRRQVPKWSLGTYKGVRMRKWGKWVSEIRVPKTKQRIWLGSYDAPEKAARAYDAALYCIKGEHGKFNFPTDRRPELPRGLIDSQSKRDIKVIALSFASSDASVSFSMTSQVVKDALSSPDPSTLSSSLNAGDREVGGYVRPSVTEAPSCSLENLQLDDFRMLDLEWIDTL